MKQNQNQTKTKTKTKQKTKQNKTKEPKTSQYILLHTGLYKKKNLKKS